MAKVKTAKQRITDFFKAKGLDTAEIKDAFDELDTADVDLDKLADVTLKNEQWVQWYQQVTPALTEIVSERDTLKQRIAKLEAAGMTFGDDKQEEPKTTNPGTLSGFNPEKFQSDMVAATNATIKEAARFGLRHLKKFNEELDYDAVEKVMSDEKIPFKTAYGLYVQPKEDAIRTKEMEDKIKLGIQEGIQAEMSKQGVRRTRKRVDDIEAAPLDKPAPSDADLKAAFIKDLDSDITH